MIMGVPVEDIISSLPTYDERRLLLARDSLASVDGFKMLIMVTYEYLFGMRVCLYCPDCNAVKNGCPCQDLFGSNAHAEGGIFGRIDAGFTSIEAQKSTGSLHAHSLLWLQCLHQHTPLAEIFVHTSHATKELLDKYLTHKQHVSRQVYASVPNEQQIEQMEASWPEYKGTEAIIRHPAYLSARASDAHGDATEWVKEYIEKDVNMLQLRKQHHVHILNPQTGIREPLTACRRKDNPKLCKGDFPRTLWLIEKAVVLCQGLINKMGMALTGRKSKLGAFHGPMNQESQNATSPAMLVLHRCNSDVQLPYRFPITAETHDDTLCGEACVSSVDPDVILQAAQTSQDAQAGYACDYCNKRQPMAFNEVKECCKGHDGLAESLHGEGLSYIGKRHATRLMSDAYGRGIVRGQAENTNLRANGKFNDVTAAECFKTCGTAAFFGREYFDMVERLTNARADVKSVLFGEIDGRNARKKKVAFRNVAVLYGERPAELKHLSPYEFVTYWDAVLCKYPMVRRR